MPSWGNTDSAQAKPHFPEERQVRLVASLITANVTAAGSNTITLTGVGSTTAANSGVVPGTYVYGGGAGVITYTGQRDFFKGNNYVTMMSNTATNNQVFLANSVTASIPAGTVITFDNAISYNNPVAANTFADTVIVSTTRLVNSTFSNKATSHAGWVRVKTGTGGRAGRVQVETLVCLANVQTSNTLSGNTSNSLMYYAGL